MRIFRQHRDEAPKVDAAALAQRVDLLARLDRTLADLAADRPGDARAVVAAGIGWLATTRAPIDMGNIAVETLLRAGWTLIPPAPTRPVRTWVAPPGSGPEVVAAAERENAAERAASDIPDDWAG